MESTIVATHRLGDPMQRTVCCLLLQFSHESTSDLDRLQSEADGHFEIDAFEGQTLFLAKKEC